MKLRITIVHVFILLILFACKINAQYDTELNMITINLEKDNLIRTNGEELKNLLNNKIQSGWNFILNGFDNEFLIPTRLMIYKDGKLIYASVCYSREKLNYEINAIVHVLDLF